MSAVPAYEPVGFFMLRAPALPVSTLTGVLAEPDATPARLRVLAADPGVRRALTIASEDLLDGLGRLDADPLGTHRKTRRVYSRLLRYVTRMCTRPTPFGAFSGVSLGTFDDTTTVRLGPTALHRLRVRADMGWLLAVLADVVESDDDVRAQLRLVRNPTLYRSGDTLVLPFADVYGRGDDRSIRIGLTAAVELALEVTATPVAHGAVVERLGAAFPDVERDRVAGLVGRLWELGVLTSDLRPPMTDPRPERRLARKLAELPAAAATTAALEHVADLADAASAATVVGAEPAFRALAAAQRRLLPSYRHCTFQVDAALDTRRPSLARSVGEAAADAAGVLMRLAGRAPSSFPYLVDYRAAFVERYGVGAQVPVLELLSPERGLDAPPTYTAPPRGHPLPPSAPPADRTYDQVVCTMAAHALGSGADEVELTDAWLERLVPDPVGWPPYPVLDVYLQVQAADAAAIDDGAWRAVLRPDGLAPGGRTYGRFADCLDERDRGHLVDLAGVEERYAPDAVFAELSYLPAFGRNANLAVRPLLRDYEVPVNAEPSVAPDRVIEVADLLVGTVGDRFYLWSRRLNREVVVTQGHMLTPVTAPNLCRFLLDVSQDGFRQPTGFGWGPMESAPRLPRVVRGRAVLRPAQWTVRGVLLDEAVGGDSDARFGEAVALWRAQWTVPRHVYLVEEDNRLLIDLENPSSRDELRQQLASAESRRAVVQEVLPALDEAWLRDAAGEGYVGEVVVPVALADAAAGRRPALARDRRPVGDVSRSRRRLPGGEWTFLKLYAPYEGHDELLGEPLRALLEQLGDLVDRWFYLRYGDPAPHLRLRFRAAPGRRPETVSVPVLRWADGLVDRGLAYDVAVASYDQEVERYGGPDVLPQVEAFFAANSDATTCLLRRLGSAGLTKEVAAVAAVDVLCGQWGLDPVARLSAVPATPDVAAARAGFRDRRRFLAELLVPWDERPDPEGRAAHEAVRDVFAAQAPVVRDLVGAIDTAGRRGRLWGSESDIRTSLVHMQVNRLFMTGEDSERAVYTIWRHALRAVRGRPAVTR